MTSDATLSNLISYYDGYYYHRTNTKRVLANSSLNHQFVLAESFGAIVRYTNGSALYPFVRFNEHPKCSAFTRYQLSPFWRIAMRTHTTTSVGFRRCEKPDVNAARGACAVRSVSVRKVFNCYRVYAVTQRCILLLKLTEYKILYIIY